jgi:hypothetical protein
LAKGRRCIHAEQNEQERKQDREGEAGLGPAGEGLDLPAGWPVHARCGDDRAHDGLAARGPKGIGSAIRMIQFLINRTGRGLAAARRRELEKAKRILQDRME